MSNPTDTDATDTSRGSSVKKKKATKVAVKVEPAPKTRLTSLQNRLVTQAFTIIDQKHETN
jgi:hypothetical protein